MSDQLPKDVGLCAGCNARNSKHATRCHGCGAVLPWAEKKVSKETTKIAPKTASTLGPPGTLPPRPKQKISAGDIDWGGTIMFLLLIVGVFLLSAVFPFWGFKMYRHFDEEQNNLKYAAAAPWVMAFLGVMAAMILTGKK